LIDADISNATGALVNITGGQDFSLDEAKKIIERVNESISSDARLIWGAQIAEDMDKTVRVMLIATGVKSTQILGKEFLDDHTKDMSNELGIEFYS
jgi:cell division protein FtsZ